MKKFPTWLRTTLFTIAAVCILVAVAGGIVLFAAINVGVLP